MVSILGIDPGFTGALAVLDSDGQLSIWDMPVYEIEVSGKKRRELNYQALDQLLFNIRAATSVAYVERVWAMPKERASASFNFGTSNGALRMGLISHSFIVHPIVPMEWRRVFQVPKGKDGSRVRATQLLPWLLENWETKKEYHNRADAALIALYGLRAIGAQPLEGPRRRPRLRLRVA